MTWTTPADWPYGMTVTEAFLHTEVRDRFMTIHGGGLGLSGQALGHIMYAISDEQYLVSDELSFIIGGGLRVGGVSTNTGVEIIANGVEAPMLIFTNNLNDRLGGIRGNDDKSMDFFAYGLDKFVERNHSSGGKSIGTTVDPGEWCLSVANDAKFGTTSNFSFVAKSDNVIYQAASDGFLIATCSCSGGSSADIVSDSSPVPMTIRSRFYVPGADIVRSSLFSPIKKGDYYVLVTGASAGTMIVDALYWIPMGING